MSNSAPSTRSLTNTTFRFGPLEFPIKLYKATEIVGLSGHLYHDGCGGKIRAYNTCELHPDLEFPPTLSCLEIGSELVPLSKEVKLGLLGGDCIVEVVSSHRLSDLPTLLSNNRVVTFRTLDMVPQKYSEAPFDSLLQRLRIKRRFLLLTLPDEKTQRYGILLPVGSVLVIHFDEEIREHKHDYIEPQNNLYRKQIDTLLDACFGDFPAQLTAQPILARISTFLESIINRKTIVARKGKVKR